MRGEKSKSASEGKMSLLIGNLPKEMPQDLSPWRGIEHHIDLTMGAFLPNRPTYRANPKETKKIQKQVETLLEKG
ncbi:hypothetical protein CR513_16589, partial [Mucuna pruriens]